MTAYYINGAKYRSGALKRVNEALKELDFQPNPVARNLKNNKVYKICVLLPNPEIDNYWLPAINGIESAITESKPFGVHVDRYLYNPLEKESFLEKSEVALSTSPDALLVAPLFRNESIQLVDKCKGQNIKVALFNNYIDSLEGEFFVGQDMVQCGRVGANLLDKMAQNGKIAILHINIEPHMLLKEQGFRAYFESKKERREQIISWNCDTSTSNFSEEFSKFIDENKDISAIFVTNSKTHWVAKELENIDCGCTLIGFDLLPENIRFLEAGNIDFLIHQKPKRQAYLGIGYLAEHFLFRKPIPSYRLLPIDIVSSENVGYYL